MPEEGPNNKHINIVSKLFLALSNYCHLPVHNASGSKFTCQDQLIISPFICFFIYLFTYLFYNSSNPTCILTNFKSEQPLPNKLGK